MSEEKEIPCEIPLERRKCQMSVVQLEVEMRGVRKEIHSISDDMHYLRDQFEKYVSKIEFFPVKLLVYGFAGLVLTGVVSALVALVLVK